MLLIRLAEILKEAVFPAKCIVCGSFFRVSGKSGSLYINESSPRSFEPEDITFEKVMAPLICRECLDGFLPAESPVCSVCGFVFKSREGEDHLCGKCIDLPKCFGKARAVGLYYRTFMEVIHSFKYKGKFQLAGPLETLLFSVLMRHWKINDFDLVVPVPLHVKRFRERGFNQAYVLVKNLAKQAERFITEPVGLKIGRDVLERTRYTEPQTGLGREKRMKNIKGAFTVRDASAVEGKRVLLVDDVYTTGATADECAKALLEGGALSVDVLTLARAV
ncbi:MAG: phosphoribosyltransferase family protein [Desulfobacterales bacterium]|nr:phosphoribosyltransferase family protein [Desulfobacterales bacterium]